MPTTLTTEGQVTIPKQIRDAQGLKPDTHGAFDVNRDGEVVIRKVKCSAKRKPDPFEAVRGKADVKWRAFPSAEVLQESGAGTGYARNPGLRSYKGAWPLSHRSKRLGVAYQLRSPSGVRQA